MRTIIVIFTERRLSLNEVTSYKKYKFLCNYNTVSLYDMVEDPRYTGKMMVVGFTCDTDRVQQGMTLKDIYITKVNGQVINQPVGLVYGSLAGSNFDIDKGRANNMEKRNIKVTLEQAIEWYNSGNETLRRLALTVFTEEELTLNFNYIKKSLIHIECTIELPCGSKKYKALADLEMIAAYFNRDWKKTTSNTGYFLGRSNLGFSNNPKDITINGLNHIGIVEHNTVMYPGIVYFKEEEDLIKAVKIMGDKIKDLFS